MKSIEVNTIRLKYASGSPMKINQWWGCSRTWYLLALHKAMERKLVELLENSLLVGTNKQTKSETRLTADILKEDQNTQKLRKKKKNPFQ